MRQIPLIFPLFLALIALSFQTVFLPKLPIIAFAPFLAIVFQRYRLITSLWIAALCGLVLDLLSSETRFGLMATSFVLVTLIAYRQRHHFFEDKPMALALYTTFISLLASIFQLLLFTLFSRKLPLTPAGLVTDLIAMPLIDGLYAFFWFTTPLAMYTRLKKR